MSIEQRIKQIRENLKLKQKEFGDPININLQQISKYERGEMKPSFEIIEKIGRHYKINLNWLIYGNGNMFLDQKSEDGDFAELNEALARLPEIRKKYYYHKIIAESLEAEDKRDDAKVREEAKGVFAYP